MITSSKFFSAVFFPTALVSVPMTLAMSAAMIEETQAFVIHSIEVRGNKLIDAQVIRDNLGIQAGRNVTRGDMDAAVKRLFGLGLFYDVKIDQLVGRLIVVVKEYEVVNQVLFQGNKSFKEHDLKRFVSLKQNKPFSPSRLSEDVRVIRRAYKTLGRDDVSVSVQIVDLGKGRANVIFNISEGRKTRISNIVFEGNKAFGERRLRDVISTKPSGVFSLFLSQDVYSEERLAADEEALRRFYYNHGYADFRIVSSKATFDAANNAYKISFVLDEGIRYRISDVQVESYTNEIDTQALKKVLKTRPGDLYNAKRIEQSVAIINNKVSNSGYAFVKVEPRGNRDFAKRTIAILYNIEQGPRVYVQKIEIRGNTRTRDYVIRREIDLNEGDAYNQTLVHRAKSRLENLGFFKEVNISMIPTDKSDQVVLLVDVVETSTGELSLTGGYTAYDSGSGLSFEVSAIERNLGGHGQYVRLGLGFGKEKSRNYNLSFFNPYFLGYRLSSGVNVFRSSWRAEGAYDVRKTGVSFRFGLPVSDELSATLAYAYTREEYDFGREYNFDNEEIVRKLYEKYSGAIVQAAKHSPWNRSSISYGLTYNTVDDMRSPHDGLYAQIMQEYAGLGGNAKFLKTTGQARIYRTLSEPMDVVGLLSVGGGHIHGIGKGGLRTFDTLKNDSSMIRGFRHNGIGPRQVSSKGEVYFLGGTTYMNATAEIRFSMPVFPSNWGFRGALFADAATLYGNSYEPVLKDEPPVTGDESAWRTSAGVSLLWDSPFGPLRFDYAWPIAKKEGDHIEKFRFGISTEF